MAVQDVMESCKAKIPLVYNANEGCECDKKSNVKYDDDKMNPFMSDQCECECFVRLEIPSYA